MQVPAELPAHEWRAPKPAVSAGSKQASAEAPAPAPVKKKVRRVRVSREQSPEARERGEGTAAEVRGEAAEEGSRAGVVAATGEGVGAVTGSGVVLSVVMRAAAAPAEVEASHAVADASAGGATAEVSRVATSAGDGAEASRVVASAGDGPEAPRVVAGEVDGVEAEGPAEDVARCQLDLSPDGDPARWRRGRAQMFAGAAFLGVGVVGLGVMVSGWYVQRFSANELSRGTGYSDEALAPLRAQQGRGETMLAAGAVTAVFGAALGATLMATGARDVRAGRAARWSGVRVAPSLGGLVLSGRF